MHAIRLGNLEILRHCVDRLKKNIPHEQRYRKNQVKIFTLILLGCCSRRHFLGIALKYSSNIWLDLEKCYLLKSLVINIRKNGFQGGVVSSLFYILQCAFDTQAYASDEGFFPNWQCVFNTQARTSDSCFFVCLFFVCLFLNWQYVFNTQAKASDSDFIELARWI